MPSVKLTYPTLEKGKSSSSMPYHWDILVPWRVIKLILNKLIVSCLLVGKCYDFDFVGFNLNVQKVFRRSER